MEISRCLSNLYEAVQLLIKIISGMFCHQNSHFYMMNNPPSLDNPSLLIMLGVILSMLRIVQLLYVYIPLKCRYMCFHLPCSHSLLVWICLCQASTASKAGACYKLILPVCGWFLWTMTHIKCVAWFFFRHSVTIKFNILHSFFSIYHEKYISFFSGEEMLLRQ